MITRRKAIAMFPAGIVAGSSFFRLAEAEPVVPIIRANPNAAREIMAKIDQTGRTPHQDATKALIDSYIRIANLRISAADSRSKLNTRQDLRDALEQQGAMHTAVNIVIDMRKKTDDIIDSEKDPYGRRLSSPDKSKIASSIIIKNNSMKEILTDLLSGPPGEFDNRKVAPTKIYQLHSISEDLLKAGRDLATWGPDTFYAMARGYATFQFIRYCIRDSQGGSSSILARAYTMKVIGECESYFALRSASLTAAAPAQTGTTPTTTPTTGQLSWTERYEVEKDMIDKRFPKQIYLGSQIGRETRCESSGRRIKNYYGTFTQESSFDRGFRMDDVVASECTNTINDKGASAMNNLLSGATKFPTPTQGSPDHFRQAMHDVEKGINDHIKFLKTQRDKENPQTPATTTTTAPATGDDVIAEFKTMQQMAAALRETLALT